MSIAASLAAHAGSTGAGAGAGFSGREQRNEEAMTHHSRPNHSHEPKVATGSPDSHIRQDEKNQTFSPPDAVVIRLRAYEISQARQLAGWAGDEVSDWSQAEEEIRSARSSMRKS